MIRTVEQELLKPLPNDLVKKHIFSLFDKKTLSTIGQVCKSWYLEKTNLQISTEEQEYEKKQEKNKILSERIKYIFNAIKEKISPEDEGVKNPRKMLSYKGYSISEPTWYGSYTVICKINTPTVKDRYVFINTGSQIRVTGSTELLTPKEIEALEEVCRNGKNPYLASQEEETREMDYSLI